MNTKKAVTAAKNNYQKSLREIALASKIARKIEPLLPAGWKIEIETICFGLEIQKDNSEKTDALEFKFVCKLVEKATDRKLSRHAKVNQENNEIRYLHADCYFSSNEVSLGINVHLFNPKYLSDCKIEWIEETVKRPRFQMNVWD